MQIYQIVNELIFGHAVSNHAIAIKKALCDAGLLSEIYTKRIDPRLPLGTGKLLNHLPPLREEDIIIYHFRIQDQLNIEVSRYKCNRIVVYHLVTPPDFSKDYHKKTEFETEYTLKHFDYCIEPSFFNINEMLKLGCSRNKMTVVPIIIDEKEYALPPNRDIVKSLSDGKTNILYVSRIVPNKKQEDAVTAFAHYKSKYNPSSRLILPGKVIFEEYKAFLDQHIMNLGLTTDDVLMPGSVPFSHILAYFATADIFLCTSEHEGFCIPLVEAMLFDIPIIAFPYTAIPETLSGSGVLLDKKDPEIIAQWIDRIMTNQEFREELIDGQREVRQRYQSNYVAAHFLLALSGYIRQFCDSESIDNSFSAKAVIHNLEKHAVNLHKGGFTYA